MASTHSTPITRKASNIANTREDVKKSEIVDEGWRHELNDRVHLYKGSVEEYFDTLVPCRGSYDSDFKRETPLAKAFHGYVPAKGKEVKNYEGLLKGLRTLVKDFKPDNKLSFYDTHATTMTFPFDDFKKHHHDSSPDISVGLPGERAQPHTIASKQWQKISMVIEVKDVSSKDPFPRKRNGLNNARTIIQLARNARNLLVAHGALFVFVIGVYGDDVRITRFDHACAVVSPPISLSSDPKLFQQFLWHFVHPRVGNTVVGADPTLRTLTDADKAWVRKQLKDAGLMTDGVRDKLNAELDKGCRVEVYNELNGTTNTFILYQMVDLNARLFSRATTVWRAMEDIRDIEARPTAVLVDKPGRVPTKKSNRGTGKEKADPIPRRFIFKQAWRQVVRMSEVSFYRRLLDEITDEERIGLAKMICGGDQGQEEVRRWEKSSENLDIMDGFRALRLSGASSSEGPSPSSSNASPPENPTSSHCGSELSLNSNFPLPYPLHQTFSWALTRGAKYTYRERSQMRIVVEDVGRPLTSAKNTRELVCAVVDAIKGHRLAWEKGGVLHRDVSLGNILIKDELPAGNNPCGFLHDFDYSSMTPVAPRSSMHPEPSEPSSSSSSQDDVVLPDDGQKERTGTYYFIAYQILQRDGVVHGIHHDLESFYWVLLWVVLRHTTHQFQQSYCTTVFVYGNTTAGANAKRAWLEIEERHVVIPNNELLTALLAELRDLVCDQIPPPIKYPRPTVPLTYDALLDAFERALAKTDWPDDDIVPCTLLDKPHTLAPGLTTHVAADDAGEEDDGIDIDDVHEEDGANNMTEEDGPIADSTNANPGVEGEDAVIHDVAVAAVPPAGIEALPRSREGMMTRGRLKRKQMEVVAAAGGPPAGRGESSKRHKSNPPHPAPKASGSKSRGHSRLSRAKTHGRGRN